MSLNGMTELDVTSKSKIIVIRTVRAIKTTFNFFLSPYI